MTLGLFPTPYPDELLYSVCARYAALVQYHSTEALNIELFGRRGVAAIIDLPSHLAFMTSQFPSGHQLTVNRLIEEHSLLPYYSPFMGLRRVHALRSAMEGDGGASVHKIAGIIASSVSLPERLRFCPQFIESDRSNYGECYWHRLHQVAGVALCPQHSIFLEESDVHTRNRANSGVYIAAEQALQITIARPLDLLDPHHRALLDLASDSSWLLAQRDLALDHSCLRERFHQALANKGLASTGGTVRGSKLLKIFKNLYPLEVLRSLECGFDAMNAYNWLPFIIKDLKRERGQAPLKFLLVIRAVGHTAESFFTFNTSPMIPADAMPFGLGPFPCLNLVCKHYREPVIRGCTIKSAQPPAKWLVGTFRCECGFGYSRRARENPEEHQYKYDRLVSYGEVWETALKHKWCDPSLSVNRIARQLGVDYKGVKHQATRLRLEFPRQGPSLKVTRADLDFQKRLNRRRRQAASMPKKMERYRSQWLAAMRQHPGATRNQLQREILPKIYHKLMRLDSEWLQTHMPPARKRKRPVKTLDWAAIDTRLVEEVRSSALRLKGVNGRPKRVTRQAIARDLDKVSVLCGRRHLDKLPLSNSAMAEVVEDRVDYYIRLILWAAECFRQENVSPSRYMLTFRACTPSDLKSLPKVKEVIDAAWLQLKTCMDSAAALAA